MELKHVFDDLRADTIAEVRKRETTHKAGSTILDKTIIPMNDLSRGIARDRAQLTDAAEAVLDSGYVVMGPQHDAFEAEVADYLGVAFALGVASGTDALELAIRVAMPKGKSTVVTAANAGGYTSIAARRAGYSVLYADVDPHTLCVTQETVLLELTGDVGVVVVTHLYGNLTDIAALVDACHERGIRVLEDCAQAIGARLPSGAAGSFGDLAAISFYPTKNLGALGDGGAVVTNDEALASQIAQLRQYGWDSKYNVAVSGGVNSRLDELQAAFLLVRLPMLDSFNERRREIVNRYAVAALGGPLNVYTADGHHHVAHLAIARTKERDDVRRQLHQRGIATDVHFPVPDHQQLGFGTTSQSLPVTELAASEVLSLPCFPELTELEIQRVCTAIGELQ